MARQTEYSMEKICEGAMEKADVLATTIEQYKEVYVTVRREFDIVMEVGLFPMLI